MTRKHYNYHSRNSVHSLFRKLPKVTINRLGREVSKLVYSHGLTYTDEGGKTTPITLTLRPRVIDSRKLKILWQTILTLDEAFQKLSRLYFEVPSLPELFPFAPQELDWLSMLESPEYNPGQIVSRWDANTTFGDEDWKEGSSFFEVNGVGVGGLWYGPACADVTLQTIVPELGRLDPSFRPTPLPDMRRLLLGILLSQRRKLRRRSGVIALAMEKASGSNFIEFVYIATRFQKWGYETIVTEPTNFRLKQDEVYAKGKKIDVIYRDTTLSELCMLEEKGHNLEALRLAFKRGQVVSSLAGEFDHKSAFEVFTNPIYASYFSSRERELFKRHILWTRLLREIKTTGPSGKVMDLIPFVLKHQSELVLKPNRLYGGKGVMFGQGVPRSVWRKKIESSLKEPGDWVIQQLGRLRTKRFFRPDGRKTKEKNLYVVSGFFATEKGLGIVGRMSERTVVNVARRGGLTPILLIK
ncbi:MAG: hypothetical protein HY447_04260 [Candidatus Omnitrophica bacterium]|nr:hypothetical protein [Candidatus Omnitrophota bacterium]